MGSSQSVPGNSSKTPSLLCKMAKIGCIPEQGSPNIVTASLTNPSLIGNKPKLNTNIMSPHINNQNTVTMVGGRVRSRGRLSRKRLTVSKKNK